MTEALATEMQVAPLGVTPLEVRGRLVVQKTAPADTGTRRLSTSRWTARLIVADAGVAVIAALLAVLSRYGVTGFGGEVVRQDAIELLPIVWLTAMALAGAYDRRVMAIGAEEFRRVCNAGVWLLAVVAVAAYVTKTAFSREVVALTIVLVTALTLVSRLVARGLLHRHISRGRPLHRVLVVGSATEARDLIRHMRRFPHSGFSIVGACVPDPVGAIDGCDDAPVPVVGPVTAAVNAVRELDADTVAVAGTASLSNPELRQLSWGLEGTGVQLVVAPAITEIAGPRIVVRPVHGLPVLHVEEPRLSGVARVVKWVIDRFAAALLIVLLSPMLVAIAVAVRVTSPGPAIFRQSRVGQGGRVFVLWKFRTMYARAEDERQGLADRNEHDGLLFKIRHDPRVTPLGRWLRRHSVDELPQLWNVLRGQMSLVGPRPALPDEVARYESDVRRRLMVKPGMTGLWQVGGRADLSWEESVRLDLYYVENWSVALDALIVAKTFSTVALGSGGY